jgi:hypothetical protein
MSRIESAIAALETAERMETANDKQKFIDKALTRLYTESDPVMGMRLVGEQIAECLQTMKDFLPSDQDRPDELARKFTVCEAALLDIRECVKDGLKARLQGATTCSEVLIQAKANHSLEDFAEVRAMKQTLREAGATMEVKLEHYDEPKTEFSFTLGSDSKKMLEKAKNELADPDDSDREDPGDRF